MQIHFFNRTDINQTRFSNGCILLDYHLLGLVLRLLNWVQLFGQSGIERDPRLDLKFTRLCPILNSLNENWTTSLATGYLV
jgi:hypothetical protein